jgi:hypothetical protein
MATYKVVVHHEFMVTTDDIDKVREEVVFTEFPLADEVDFVEGYIDWNAK